LEGLEIERGLTEVSERERKEGFLCVGNNRICIRKK
jgi:hypothetical protein